MAEEDKDIDKEKSKYNEANLNIQRLHNAWLRCAHYRRNAEYQKWKWELDNIWSELCQDVGEKRMSNHKETEKEFEEQRDKIGAMTSKDDLYESISKLHIFLRRLQDRVGKGGTYQDASSEGMD